MIRWDGVTERELRYNSGMKKSKPKTVDYSEITLRNLARHKMPPPAFRMKDRRHDKNKYACRGKFE